MSKRLTGLNPLAYMGVEPITPAATYNQLTDPTVNDFQGFNLGDVWVNKVGIRVWIFMGQDNNRDAIWLEMAASGSVGASDFITDSGTAVTNISGEINVVGGTNMNTAGTGDTVTINLDDSVTLAGTLSLPNTAMDGTAGIINFGGSPFINNYGLDNVFIGLGAGNLTLNPGIGEATGNIAIGSSALTATFSGGQNVAIGYNSQITNISGDFNCSIGDSSLAELISGNQNTSIGVLSLQQLKTGAFNSVFGAAAGQSYTTSESNNIIIGNNGVIADNNTIRIGTQGGGEFQQNLCFIAGIRGATTTNNDAIAVLVDSAGQLGTISSSRIYKENITDMRSQSEAILSLRPVTFNYKDDERKHKQYGLIAEEVAEIMTDLVVYDEDGSPETVKYHVLVPLLLNEVQRLHERLASLEDKCTCSCRS